MPAFFRAPIPRSLLRTSLSRKYTTTPGYTQASPGKTSENGGKNSNTTSRVLALVSTLGLGYIAYDYYIAPQTSAKKAGAHVVPAPGGPVLNKPPAKNAKPLNYETVYKRIVDMLNQDTDYEDGSYGPVLLRLAWHASGTYCASTNTGGSNKATMRFPAESNHGGNAGLGVARNKLEPIKQEFPDISYGDLWTLAGVAAIQQMGGPTIPWRGGRVDGFEHDCTPDGRLPDGSKDAKHLRKDIFYRMGFNDQEIVALSGAHSMGRCHTDRSGFTGPWTPSPTLFTNDYFVRLFEEQWVEKKWNGPKQYTDAKTGELMMLPTDMVLKEDSKFRKYAEQYARDDNKFRTDFAAVCRKLFELGVPFKGDEKVFEFKS